MAQQPKAVAALRARLLRRGYTEVSIRHMHDDRYCIKAVDPLAQQYVITYGTLVEVDNLMRRGKSCGRAGKASDKA